MSNIVSVLRDPRDAVGGSGIFVRDRDVVVFRVLYAGVVLVLLCVLGCFDLDVLRELGQVGGLSFTRSVGLILGVFGLFGVFGVFGAREESLVVWWLVACDLPRLG